jgi:flagella basal body P-ring formation protein FlgA
MLFSLLLMCCVGSAEMTLDAETITVGVVLQLPASDTRASLSLGRAPAPGLARRIPGYEVAARIQSAGLSSEDLTIPGSILVRRKAQPLDKDQVRRSIMDAFVRKFSTAQIDLVEVDTPSVDIAPGPVTLTASLPPRFDANVPVFVRLDIRGGNFYRTVYVRVSARIQVLQPVLRAQVAANSEIRADQLEWTNAPLDANQVVPSSFAEFKGMLAKRDLNPGQVVTPALLYTPLYVHKGETVLVRAVSGGVVIAATMRAKSAGRLGETVTVEHLSGEGSATARVVGPRTLEAF